MRLNKVIAATLTAGFVGVSGVALAAHHEGAGEAAEAVVEQVSETATEAVASDEAATEEAAAEEGAAEEGAAEDGAAEDGGMDHEGHE